MTRLLVIVWLLALPRMVVAAPPDDAGALIRAYNARDIGAPGWRRVVLELRTKGVVTRRLVVSNAWRTAAGSVRTLFVLEAPEGLRGISYLMTERADADRFLVVHLFLPTAAKRLLEVAPALEEQALLGSDFSYRDLSWQLPERGFDRRVIGEGTLMEREVTFVEYTARAAGDTWPRRRYAFSRSPVLLVGIDFYRAGASAPDKTLRVDRLEQRGQVWTPTQITVKRGDSTSVLSLEAAAFATSKVPDELLTPEGLAGAALRARDGAKIEQLLDAGPP